MKAAICVECKPARALAAGDINEKHLPTHVVNGKLHSKVVVVERDPIKGEKVIPFMKRMEKEWRAGK